MFKQVLPRLLFVVFAVIFALYTYVLSVDNDPELKDLLLYIFISVIFSVGLVVWERFCLKNLAREMVALLFGITTGLFASGLILVIAGLFLVPYNILNTAETTGGEVGPAILRALWQVQFITPLVLAACLYLGVTVVLQTRNDFRFLIPYIDFSRRGTQEGGILLDTSALIDGRITGICRSGIITAPLVISDYVLRELQTLADGKDRLKRERGRRGLDIAAELQKMEGVRVAVRTSEGSTDEVDDRLVRDAKLLNARLITTDFNLNKLGKAEGVAILNINELSEALKPQYIPGDALLLRIIRKGQEAGQGVGYLEDGTMVVVDNGEKYIGETTRIAITGSIQTSAGRMIFGTAQDAASERGNNGNS